MLEERSKSKEKKVNGYMNQSYITYQIKNFYFHLMKSCSFLSIIRKTSTTESDLSKVAPATLLKSISIIGNVLQAFQE